MYEPVGLKSDAALIQLDGRVLQGKYAKPVCLPPNNIEQNQVRFGMVGEVRKRDNEVIFLVKSGLSRFYDLHKPQIGGA